MFSHAHYVPILKARPGELRALAKLSLSAKENLTPLLDIPRAGLDRDTKKVKPLETYLRKKAKAIRESWVSTRPFFVDLMDMDLSLRTSDGAHPVTFILNYFQANSVESIPTTGLERDEAYNLAIADIISKTKCGTLIRLLEDDLISTRELNSKLLGLLKTLNLSLENTHLLLDFGSICGRDEDEILAIVADIINGLPEIDRYQTLTIAASGMPLSQQLSKFVKTGENGVVARKELKLWKLILKSRIKRKPSFADYAIVHPVHYPYDHEKMTIAPTIRYTTEEEWAILRGISTRKHPLKMKQYYGLSASLMARREYRGQGYCHGDRMIAEKAQGMGGSGNPQSWIEIGTNHHLTFVSEQISEITRLQ